MANLEPRLHFFHNGRPRACSICGETINNVQPRIVTSDKTSSNHYHLACSTWFATFVSTNAHIFSSVESFPCVVPFESEDE